MPKATATDPHPVNSPIMDSMMVSNDSKPIFFCGEVIDKLRAKNINYDTMLIPSLLLCKQSFCKLFFGLLTSVNGTNKTLKNILIMVQHKTHGRNL